MGCSTNSSNCYENGLTSNFIIREIGNSEKKMIEYFDIVGDKKILSELINYSIEKEFSQETLDKGLEKYSKSLK